MYGAMKVEVVDRSPAHGSRCPILVWERCCNLVHPRVGHLSRAPSDNPVAVEIRWSCHLHLPGGWGSDWRQGRANWRRGAEDAMAEVIAPNWSKVVTDHGQWQRSKSSFAPVAMARWRPRRHRRTSLATHRRMQHCTATCVLLFPSCASLSFPRLGAAPSLLPAS